MSTKISLDQLRNASRGCSAADHPGKIRACYPFWDTRYRPFLLQAVAELPAERFDFKPRPEMFTAHQVVVHIAEDERGMNHLVEGGPYEKWVVPHEDPKQGWVTVVNEPDHAALYAMLEREHKRTQHWLDQPASELSRVITWKGDAGATRQATLHWILDGLQQHEIHHRGQLNLYLRLMGIEPFSI